MPPGNPFKIRTRTARSRGVVLSCLALALLAPPPAPADVIGPGGKTVQDCYCTDSSGGRVELGETICLRVDGRMFMAQCQMSLNVPMWREVQSGCLSARLQDLQPAIDARLVHPQVRGSEPLSPIDRQNLALPLDRGIVGKAEQPAAGDIGDHPLAHRS